jgi:hypothetical protein
MAPPARKWWTLATVCVAVFMLLLDITVVSTALPSIRDDLGARFTDLQWVVDAYTLTLAALVLTAGSLADRLGRRRVFPVGLGAFTAASLLCGLAPDPTFLNLARAVQGVGGAILFAVSLALIAQGFAAGRERANAMGAFGATIGVAVAVGPLVGGALTDTLGWEWVFFINVPIGAAAIAVIDVRPGQRVAVFAAVGTTTAPRVTLVGPRGERVTADPAGFADDRFRVAIDPDARTAYFAVAQPSPGRWRLQLEPGSAPVSAFRTAVPRAPVRIRARVRSAGDGARRLSYRATGLANGRVRFVEVGPDIRRVLRTTDRARGSVRFRPAPGPAGRRRVVAVVVRDGAPEPARVVARFRAPRAGGPAPPRHVRVRARGLRRVIGGAGVASSATGWRSSSPTGGGSCSCAGGDTAPRCGRCCAGRACASACGRSARSDGPARPARSGSRGPGAAPPRAAKPCAAATAHASC